jgi:hypothetical protein
MRDAVRGLVADDRIAGRRQSQTLRNMLRGAMPVCYPLEKVVAEAINTNVPDDRILRVAATFGRETRRLLGVRSAGATLSIEETFERETVVQGETDVRQMRAIERRDAAALLDAWDWMTRHINALRMARYAVELELAKRFNVHARGIA